MAVNKEINVFKNQQICNLVNVSVDILLAIWHLRVSQKKEPCASWNNTVPMVLFRSGQFDSLLWKYEQVQIYLFLNNML